MEAAVDYAVKVGGATVGILVLILAYTFVKEGIESLGAIGKWVSNTDRGKGLRQKASDYRDYRENLRKGEALSGGRNLGSGKYGKYARAQRRALRNQSAEAGAKSGEAQFGVSDTKASEFVQSMAKSNAQVSAINTANNTRFATNVAKGETNVSEGMNPKVAEDEHVEKALLSQQERAIAEAIKDVELSAKFEPGDIAAIGTALEEAIKKGDSIGARAYQNILMKSGGPGTSEYRDTMSKITADEMAAGTPTGDAITALKHNMLINHGGIKETAADLIKHASDTDNRTMTEVTSDAATWKLSNEDLVKQKSHSLEKAVAAGGVPPAQAREIQADEQLYRKLDPKGRAAIDTAARQIEAANLTAVHEQAINEEARRSGGGP